ncbi:hypothetical protein Q2941_45190, partial [Bradyrhizobium sp. UFLA05-153]
FLAQSNTCSRQITATDQSLPNSSRATNKTLDRFWPADKVIEYDAIAATYASVVGATQTLCNFSSYVG